MITPEQLRLAIEQKSKSGHSAYTPSQVADRAISEDSFLGKKLQKAAQLGITKQQALNFYAYGSANGRPPAAKPQGFFESIASDVQKRRVQFGEGVERYQQGQQGLASTALQFAGRSAQAAGDMIGGALAPAVNKIPEIAATAMQGFGIPKQITESQFDLAGKALSSAVQSKPAQNIAKWYQGLSPVTRANIESATAVGMAALDVIPGAKVAPRVAKEIADGAVSGVTKAVFRPKTVESLVSEVDGIVGKIIQGDKASLDTAKSALRIVDTTGVKTYEELNSVLRDKISALATKQNSVLDTVQDSFPIDSFVRTSQVGNVRASTNHVANALDHLQELYLKTGQIDDFVRIKAMKETATVEGLTARQVNDIAREYGAEAPKAFNPRTGDPLTSVNAQLSETTRKGVKEAARSLLPDDTSRLLDEQMSNLFDTLRNTETVERKVLNLAQKVSERGLVESVGRALGRTLDLATMGGLRGFLTSMFPSNVGLKMMNYLQIQEGLSKNLSRLDDLLSRIDTLKPQKAAEEVVEVMQSFRRSFSRSPDGESLSLRELRSGTSPEVVSMQKYIGDLQNEIAAKEMALADIPDMRGSMNRRTGELPEVTGVGKAQFARTGDDVADRLGYSDSEALRVDHERAMQIRSEVESLKQTLKDAKNELSALKSRSPTN